MTKAEERKTLSQIAELIRSTGEDSYIACAFRGCVEDAERNIEDDAAYSAADRADRAESLLIAAEDAEKQAETALAAIRQTHCELIEDLREIKKALAAAYPYVKAARDAAMADFQALESVAPDTEILNAARKLKIAQETMYSITDAIGIAKNTCG